MHNSTRSFAIRAFAHIGFLGIICVFPDTPERFWPKKLLLELVEMSLHWRGRGRVGEGMWLVHLEIQTKKKI